MLNNVGIVIKKPFATLRQERIAKLENGLCEKSLRFQQMADNHEIDNICAEAEDSFESSYDRLDKETESFKIFYEKLERQFKAFELRKSRKAEKA